MISHHLACLEGMSALCRACAIRVTRDTAVTAVYLNWASGRHHAFVVVADQIFIHLVRLRVARLAIGPRCYVSAPACIIHHHLACRESMSTLCRGFAIRVTRDTAVTALYLSWARRASRSGGGGSRSRSRSRTLCTIVIVRCTPTAATILAGLQSR